jgi:hypothetical protein
MSKYFRVLLVLLNLGIVNFTLNKVRADTPYEKNNMPCIEGVCLKDDIQSLKNINWISVNKKLSNRQNTHWKAIGDQSSLQNLVPYLSAKVIDSKGINLLAKIQGFCTVLYANPIFSGFYKGKDGKPIEVNFTLIYSSDRKSQKIVVSEIDKLVASGEFTSEQLTSLGNEAAKRYPNSISKTSLPQTSVTVYPRYRRGDNSVHLRLFYNNISAIDGFGGGEFLKFPGCTNKVNL